MLLVSLLLLLLLWYYVRWVYVVGCCLQIFRCIVIFRRPFVCISFTVESILVIFPAYCIVFSFYILVIRICRDHWSHDGLLQSGHIANQDLQNHLAKYEYYPTKRTPRLWKHQTRPISFTLVVDNFGIKYTNTDDIDDLFKVIKKLFT